MDPQLHTHAVIANMVDSGNGRFTAIHNDHIYRSKKLITEVYSKELEKGLYAAGYDVSRDKNGLVQIEGFHPKVLDKFSMRSQQIAASLRDRGEDQTPKSAELAALATRAAKQEGIDREILSEHWRNRASQLGLTKEYSAAVITKAKYKANLREQLKDENTTARQANVEAKAAIEKAVEHVSERKSVYARNEVLEWGSRFSSDKTSMTDLINALDRKVASKDILPVNNSQTLITDKQTALEERTVVKIFRSSQRDGGVRLARYFKNGAEAALEQRLNRTHFTPGQREAVLTALTGKERFVGVQGYAGTGKTTMLSRVVSEAEKAGYEVDGLAPSKRAVDALKQSVPNTVTLQSVTVAQRAHPTTEDNSKRILVVDESSMVATRDMLTLMQYADRTNYARVVLLGDVKQHAAIERGGPFDALQRAGMRTATMLDIVRQDPSSPVYSAVLSAIKGDKHNAFNTIGTDIQQSENVAKTLAQKYIDMTPQGRENTAVLVLTNAMRGEVNSQVREGLRSEGTIGQQDVRYDTLKPIEISRVMAADVQSYRPGEVVQSLTSNAKLGLSKRALYDVTQVDQDAKTLTMRSITGPKKGETIELELNGHNRSVNLKSFERQDTPLAAGDKVRFRMHDTKTGVENGDRGEVISVTEAAATVRLESGTKLTIASTRNKTICSSNCDCWKALSKILNTHLSPKKRQKKSSSDRGNKMFHRTTKTPSWRSKTGWATAGPAGPNPGQHPLLRGPNWAKLGQIGGPRLAHPWPKTAKLLKSLELEMLGAASTRKSLFINKNSGVAAFAALLRRVWIKMRDVGPNFTLSALRLPFKKRWCSTSYGGMVCAKSAPISASLALICLVTPAHAEWQLMSASNDRWQSTTERAWATPDAGENGALPAGLSQDKLAALNSLIGDAVSGAHGYDAVNPAPDLILATLPPEPLSTMPLSALHDWIESTPDQDHVLGKYQLTARTLRSVQERLDLPDSAVFDAMTQDAMARRLYLDAGIAEYIDGTAPADLFLDRLAIIWPELPAGDGGSLYAELGHRATISREDMSDGLLAIFAETVTSNDGWATAVFTLNPRVTSRFVDPRLLEELGALISAAESPRDGYDAVIRPRSGERFVPPPAKPTSMTLGDIHAWVAATPNQDHAIGKYQIIPKTFRTLQARLSLPSATPFNAETRDQMARVLYDDAGLMEFLDGTLSLDLFMDRLAIIWADRDDGNRLVCPL